MKKVVIFARVSTNIQDYERQVNELTAIELVTGTWVCRKWIQVSNSLFPATIINTGLL
jgi:predicted site-specific integrase-resolvase